MAGYTKQNLKEVEDQAPKFGLSPDLEARFARVALDAELIGITYQRLGPNFRLPFAHTHKTQEEVFLLISGSASFKVGDEILELKPWDAVRVHKDVLRTFGAGPEGAEFVVVGCPGGPGDAETVEHSWEE
jgi:mannose-6-phosphate isomerase-like protein (cupin superfamily)